MSLQLFTRNQLLKLFEAWGVTEAPPAKGKAVYISFPRPSNPSLAVVTKAQTKSTYGKALYACEFSNP